MKKLLIVAAMLVGCTNDSGPDYCGVAPPQPGFAVHIETINGVDYAAIPSGQYQALALYLDQMSDWRTCMANGGLAE